MFEALVGLALRSRGAVLFFTLVVIVAGVLHFAGLAPK